MYTNSINKYTSASLIEGTLLFTLPSVIIQYVCPGKWIIPDPFPQKKTLLVYTATCFLYSI